jgi:alpha,alpha-trehalose phosphorylase
MTAAAERNSVSQRNGYIGIRYAFEEGYPEGYESVPGQYINGVYDILAVNQAESCTG